MGGILCDHWQPSRCLSIRYPSFHALTLHGPRASISAQVIEYIRYYTALLKLGGQRLADQSGVRRALITLVHLSLHARWASTPPRIIGRQRKRQPHMVIRRRRIAQHVCFRYSGPEYRTHPATSMSVAPPNAAPRVVSAVGDRQSRAGPRVGLAECSSTSLRGGFLVGACGSSCHGCSGRRRCRGAGRQWRPRRPGRRRPAPSRRSPDSK